MKKIFLLPILCLYGLLLSANPCALMQDDVEGFITHECEGDDGAIDVTVYGGEGMLEYYWYTLENGEFVFIDNGEAEDIQGLSQGTYRLVVIDEICSKAILDFEVKNIELLINTLVTKSCSPIGGSIEVNVLNGSGEYRMELRDDQGGKHGSIVYIKDPSYGDENFDNLSTGSYTLTVSDKVCGSVSRSIQILSNPIIIEVVRVTGTCTGLDGAIDISVSGGVEPYVYDWSDGSTGEDLLDVSQGSFSVTVTDVNGCTNTATDIVGLFNTFQIIRNEGFNNNKDACNGSNGKIHITVTDPLGLGNGLNNSDYPPALRLWSNGQNNNNTLNKVLNNTVVSGLADLYAVTITDIFGCSNSAIFEIEDGSFEVFEVSRMNSTSCADPNGEIIIETSKPGIYEYVWSNGSTSKDLINASPGNYVVTVTSAVENGIRGCEVAHTFELLEGTCCVNEFLEEIVIINGKQGENIPSGGSGIAEIYISGGSGDFSVICSDQFGNEISMSSPFKFLNLISGQYFLKIVDLQLGCFLDKTFRIKNENCVNDLANLFFTTTNKDCSGSIDKDKSCNSGSRMVTLYTSPLSIERNNIFYPITITMPSYATHVINNIDDLQNFIGFNTSIAMYCVPKSTTPYVLSISDGCYNVKDIEIKTCDECGYFAFDDSNKDLHRYRWSRDNQTDINDDAFGLNIDNPCRRKLSGWHLWRTNDEIKIPKNNAPSMGVEFKVTWPNGDVTFVTNNGKGKCKFEGVSSWNPSNQEFVDGGPYPVIIERTDGCLYETINVYWGQTYNNMYLETDPNGSVSCMSKCLGGCNSQALSVGPSFSFNMCPADIQRDKKYEPFDYIPYDKESPCDGGLLSVLYWDSDSKINKTPYFEFIGYGQETDYVPVNCYAYNCFDSDFAGGCIFDFNQLNNLGFGFPPGQFYAPWCLIEKSAPKTIEIIPEISCPNLTLESFNCSVILTVGIPFNYSGNSKKITINKGMQDEAIIYYEFQGETEEYFTFHTSKSESGENFTVEIDWDENCGTISRSIENPGCEDEFNDPPPPQSDATCKDSIINMIYDPTSENFILLHQNVENNEIAFTGLKANGFTNKSAKLYNFNMPETKANNISKTLNNLYVVSNKASLSVLTKIEREDDSINHIEYNSGKINKISVSPNDNLYYFGKDQNNNAFVGQRLNDQWVNLNVAGFTSIDLNANEGSAQVLQHEDGSNLYRLKGYFGSTLNEEWQININLIDIKYTRILSGNKVLIVTNNNTVYSLVPGDPIPISFQISDRDFTVVGIDEARGTNFILYGEYVNALNIDGQTYPSNGGSDLAFITLSSDLSVLNVKTQGGPNNESILGAAIAEKEKIAYFGTFEGSTTLEGISFTADGDCYYVTGTNLPECPDCGVNCEECEDCTLCPECEFCNPCEDCTDCTICPDCEQCEECNTCTDCSLCPQCPDCIEYCNTCTDCTLCPDCPDCVTTCETCTDCEVCPWCPDCQVDCATCNDCTLCPDCPDCVSTCETCTDCALCPWCPDCEVDCATCTDCTLCPTCPDCELICVECDDCDNCPWCPQCDPANQCMDFVSIVTDNTNAEAELTLDVPVNSIIRVSFYFFNGLDWELWSTTDHGPVGPGIVQLPVYTDGFLNMDLKLVVECLSCNNDCPPTEVFFDTHIQVRSTESNKDFNIHIYPNPSTKGFTADIFEEVATNSKIEVYNSSGKLIFKDNLPLAIGGNRYFLADSPTWPSGLYYVIYKSRSKTLTKKLLKIE